MPTENNAEAFLREMQETERWLHETIDQDPLLAGDIIDAANRYTLRNTGCSPEDLRAAVEGGIGVDDPALGAICVTWYTFVAEARRTARA